MDSSGNKSFFGLAIFTLFLLIFSAGSCSILSSPLIQEEAIPETADRALRFAESKIGSDYEWGGNGPETFDCSGLIVWSYQSAVGDDYIFTDGSGFVKDISMAAMYLFNVRSLEPIDVLPGDIIFFADEDDYIVHGGLIREIDSSSVSFVNAASPDGTTGEVEAGTWDLNQISGGQHIKGFGRMLISY
ncbi:MAG: C40 family peptidase [Spirochaetales bacterium]|nr:C40 family peptidase [Spirochaetales bacterium]